MDRENVKTAIANMVCERFINEHATTSRRTILLEFENPDLLDEMEMRNLLRALDQRENYLPTVGSFALLGDDHQLYQFAHTAFDRTVHGLRSVFRSEKSNVDHTPTEFETYVNTLTSEEAPKGLIALGLYLAMEFGALSPLKMSDDRTMVESFRVAEQVIKMRDSKPWWMQRVQASREPSRPFGVPIEQLQATAYEDSGDEDAYGQPFDDNGFWTLIHPAISAEAHSRFMTKHYADAVEAALKVVAHLVRSRTGLTQDGSDLMHQAFSPNGPYLIFQDPIPETQRSMQQGYMQVFAGAMTGIRNPKAHGMVTLDRRRAIHFLFLASLLAHKIDEATDAPRNSKP